MQLLLLDIMLSTLVTFASAQYTFWVSPEGNMIKHYFRMSNIQGILQRARAVNCVPLFGFCGPNLRCCDDSIPSIYPDWADPIGTIKQMPPSTIYTIKCSAAQRNTGYESFHINHIISYISYHKANIWEKRFGIGRMNRMNSFCLPKAPRPAPARNLAGALSPMRNG